MESIFRAKIDRAGNLTIERPVEYRQHLLNMVRGKDEAMAEVIVRKPRRKKSRQAHNYYMGVICATLAEYTGHTREEIHQAMKVMFLSYEDNGIVYQKSTMDLSTSEAETYHASIRAFAMDTLQVYVPLPSEVDGY